MLVEPKISYYLSIYVILLHSIEVDLLVSLTNLSKEEVKITIKQKLTSLYFNISTLRKTTSHWRLEVGLFTFTLEN